MIVIMLNASFIGCSSDDDEDEDDEEDDDLFDDDDDDDTASYPDHRLSLNGVWKFLEDPDDTGESQMWYEPGYNDENWRSTKVPGNWNYLYRDSEIPETDSDYDGIGWYRTSFQTPADMEYALIKLHFGAVCYKSKVWLNGNYLGEHEGDFLPFEFDVSEKLRFGEVNVLALRVETINAESVNTLPAAVGRYDYWIYSGIHRDVYLEFTDRVTVYDIFAHGEPAGNNTATATVEAKILNAGVGQAALLVKASLYEKGSTTAFDSQEQHLIVTPRTFQQGIFEFNVSNPNLWSPESPNLYVVKIEVFDDTGKAANQKKSTSKEVEEYDPHTILTPRAALTVETTEGRDAASCRFGLRKIETSGRQILLNGEQIIFKGVNRHDEYPMMGRAIPEENIREDLEMMKLANMNSLCTAHYPNNPEVYDLADELGFLVIEEIPATSLNFDEMKDQDEIIVLASQYLEGMVQRDKNHPSIVIWSALNEPQPWGVSNFNSPLYQVIRDIDNTRLVGYARHNFDIVARDDDADVLMFNLYWGWYQGMAWDTNWALDAIEYLFHERPIIITEFGAGALKDERSLSDPQTSPHFTEDYQSYHLLKTWEAIDSKFYVSGGTIWVWADFLSPTRKYLRSKEYRGRSVENPLPYYNLKGLVDRNRVPKNGYLTVMGMFGNMPLYDLTVDVTDSEGTPVADAVVNIYLEEGTLVGRQLTDVNGETILWNIPGQIYEVEAQTDSQSASSQVDLQATMTETIALP